MHNLYLLGGLFAEISLNTSINVEYLTVYKVGCLGCEEYGGACKVGGVAPAACGSFGIGDEAVEGVLRAICLRLTQGNRLGRCDVAGADAVALNVVLAVLGGDVSR